ncbi:acetoacetyl-CoA synthetase-like [Rhopilema esculentum]|uniref:acetoacetyl-CoA synthetase-like n=1 Tax=Rhopilema esculentum TaxID=499914 RepID=UPI0031DE7A08|eukprot:gene15159-6351_t
MKLRKDADVLWTPRPDIRTQMDEFRCHVNKKFAVNIENYQDLWQWSVDNTSLFWGEFWHFSGLKYSQKFESVVDTSAPMSDIPEWFPGSRLNYAENLLQGDDEDVALYTAGERRSVETVTFRELRKRVSILSNVLKKKGVKKGDRVVGYIPNCSLAVEAMLAAASLGAVWSSTSPDFGVAGVLDRFSQIKPKVIFSVDAVIYNNKIHNHLEKLTKVIEELPELEVVVVAPYVGNKDDIDISGIKNSIFLPDFLALADPVPLLEFEQLPFNHPLFIMYSSGTTGHPKCIVHSAGGTLIQHLKEHKLHGDMKRKDIMLYYTTTGWMMWNWLVSVLAVGASAVLYDGSPLVPSPNVLWDLIDEISITVLGTGARWLEALSEKSVTPIETHNVASLRAILSTGSPLQPDTFKYVYTSIKKDLLLGSITGGTDIISCFAGSNPTLPVYRGEIQSRNLGMAVESWSEEGSPVFDESGELVCKKAFPCMPIYFWNDEGGVKYRKAYFNKFPGVWAHGDFCQVNSLTGGILMLGRSDGTLNPSGVRFGSAEIYNIVNPVQFPEITDSLCVGNNHNGRERVVLFLKMADQQSFNDDLVREVKKRIREELSARHVPEIILPIRDIPYTTSGKKVEVAVKRILAGEHIAQRGSLINPDSLDFYYGILENGENGKSEK